MKKINLKKIKCNLKSILILIFFCFCLVKKVSMADLIVLAGSAAVEEAAKEAGFEVVGNYSL